ncbi:hypothetical protein PVBG_06188 [Plasmodium vivax Brazil I]|uniref:Uncharacterized protein n=1 Tax=Plasmodium vivax (strain Brazil I) TaxID=1033975 RepID=A0A0J9T409_PLAV1|nr:hypothetical protein PVBG_06188 [Plasmodium vivax Brazil I]
MNNKGRYCELTHYFINENNFKNIKLFFDYSQDYISYEQQLTGHNHSCNEEYKTYLDKYVKSYKDDLEGEYIMQQTKKNFQV